MTKRKRLRVMIIFAVIILAFIGYCFYENNALGLTEIKLSSEKLPQSFDKMKIIHISDLHNKSFGENNRKLLEMIKAQNPDIIVMTGDLIDKRRTTEETMKTGISLMAECQKIAPTYFISGNHETTISYYDKLERELVKAGVTILNDKSAVIEKNGEKIGIAGISNFSFNENSSPKIRTTEKEFKEKLSRLKSETDESFDILLAHRPERFEFYSEAGFDLTLSGHAHGGQWRFFDIPLVAPDQGFFGAYTSGLYEENGEKMIVSRGLGNSIIPMRINNPPELISITLESEAGS